jgi:arylsulfatase A-like enzyme
MKRSLLLGLVSLLGATVAAFWWRTTNISTPLGVVLITLDTTRADRLSAYGFMDATMPALDRLARDGIVFDQALSPAPLTLPAHCSLFTGLYPPSHGVSDNADPALAEEYTTLAEVLRARGFRTAAFVGSEVLGPDRGLKQGFEHYDTGGLGTSESIRRQRPANEVIAQASGWLEQAGDSRFFLWAHLYDAHRPYDPPPPFESMVDPYIAEITFADSQIARLLEVLERRNLLDRTIVVVAGDHGESLGEHGERDHGIFLYESVLRVPLIMRVPGLPARRIDDLVRLVDVMPTLTDLLGVPDRPMDGVSLVDSMAGRQATLGLHAFSESLYPQRFGWSPLRALREGRFKVIDAPRPELYDIELDPLEQVNIYSHQRAKGDALVSHARALSSRLSARVAAKKGAIPSNVRQSLLSLGYVGSPRVETSSTRESLPDPKDCIGLHPFLDDQIAPKPPVGSKSCGVIQFGGMRQPPGSVARQALRD